MQHSDNHIDDVFRRAAENYQLNTQHGNWGEVAGKLGTKKDKRYLIFKSLKKIRISILLILLISGAGTGLFFLIDEPKSQRMDLNQLATSSSLENKNLKAVTNTAIEYSKEKMGINLYSNRNSNDATFKEKPGSSPHQPVVKQTEILFRNSGAMFSQKQKTIIVQTGVTFVEKVPLQNYTVSNFLQIQAGTKSTVLLNTPKFRIEAVADAITPYIKTAIKRKRVYAEFVAGVGYTVVKNQQITRPGLEFGIKAGYRFHNKLSVETGLLVARRNYFSDGKYFKMDQNDPSMPGGMQIINLEGSSHFFQVPLRVKIDFLQKKKSSVFITAGVNSSLLINEKNNYLTLLNGVKQHITTSYKNQRYYIAASSEFSAGYQFNLYNNKSIRIEPYLQVPIKGIGVGKMPLTGAGLHVGFSIF